MIIKCPECGKDISDKSEKCIHCGFPLADIKKEKLYSINIVSIKDYNFMFKIVIFISKIAGLDDYVVKEDMKTLPYMFVKGLYYNKALEIQNALENIGAKAEIFENNECGVNHRVNKMEIPYYKDKDNIKCPKCGSKSISTGSRGYSIITGFWGAGNTVNRCANCGYKWKP